MTIVRIKTARLTRYLESQASSRLEKDGFFVEKSYLENERLAK